MKSRHEQKIQDGAKPLLEEGESVLAAFVARPRGWTQSGAGSIQLGAHQQGRAYAAAEQAGLRLASPMALAITQRRLIVFKISSPIGLGIGGRVKELYSVVPIADVESIEIQRLVLGQVVTLTIRGSRIKLEANALAGARHLAEVLDRAKATA
jgi:hypothetical protein